MTIVQETHRIGCEQLDFNDDDNLNKGWQFINCGLKVKHAHGAGLILSPNVVLHDKEQIMSGRILYARVTIKGIKVSAFSAYAPTELAPESTKVAFLNKLKQAIRAARKDHPNFRIVVGGDMNSTIGTDVRDCRFIGNNNDDCVTNKNGEMLVQFCEEMELSAMNTIYQTKIIHRHTWRMPTGFTKRIDYFLVDNFIRKCSTNCRVYRGASVDYESDHFLLVLDLSCMTKCSRTKYFHKRKPSQKPLINTLKSLDIQVQYSEHLDNYLQNKELPVEPNVFEHLIVESITNARKSTVPIAAKKTIPPPWLNDEFQIMLERRRNCRNLEAKKAITKEIKCMRQKLKSSYYSEQAQKINRAAEMRKIEEEFRLMNTFKASKRYASKKNVITTAKLTDHFREHFSERECQKQPEVLNPENYPYLQPTIATPIDESLPKEDEIKYASKSLRNGKCIGTDKIHNEEIKYNTSGVFMQMLLMMMCLLWTVVKYPASWYHSVISCIYKNKGKASEGGNYRGLSMNATLNKVFMSVILNRIRGVYEDNIMEAQFGFRKNRSTTDAIFVIRNVIEKTDGFFVGCFIDLRAAYDHINRDMLFDILLIRLGCKVIVNLLRELYCNTTAAIKASRETFRTFIGCRQGAKESPCLFNIYLDFVLRIIEHEVLQRFPSTGIRYSFNYPPECTTRGMRSKSPAHGTDFLRMLLYADDIVILCRDVNELEEIMNIYFTVFKRFGLTIAGDKTKTMVFNAEEEVAATPSIISINGEAIENVRTFRYLGHILSNVGKLEFVHAQIASAHQKWSEIKEVLTDGEIQMSTRLMFLETCIRSRLLYSIQACRLSNDGLMKLEVVWMNFLRRLVKGGFKRQHTETEENWAYKYSNDDILRITGATLIKSFCIRQRLKYIGHVVRQQNHCYTKRWLFATPERRYYRDEWKLLEDESGLDRMTIRKRMMKKEDLLG